MHDRLARHALEPDTPFTDDRVLPTAPVFHHHRRWLLAALRLRFGRDAAEDLVQETFLRVAANPPAKAILHPRAWLLRIALNAARDQHRRRSVRPPLTDADGAAPLSELPVSGGQEQALLLKQVILSLPPPLRETFLLSRFGGLTYEEIARRLGIATKTVEWRMTKALAICAARLHD